MLRILFFMSLSVFQLESVLASDELVLAPGIGWSKPDEAHTKTSSHRKIFAFDFDAGKLWPLGRR